MLNNHKSYCNIRSYNDPLNRNSITWKKWYIFKRNIKDEKYESASDSDDDFENTLLKDNEMEQESIIKEDSVIQPNETNNNHKTNQINK